MVIFRFLTKILIFNQHYKKILGKKFDFWQKFGFLVKIWIFGKKLGFIAKKNWIDGKKFGFMEKCGPKVFFDQDLT